MVLLRNIQWIGSCWRDNYTLLSFCSMGKELLSRVLLFQRLNFNVLFQNNIRQLFYLHLEDVYLIRWFYQALFLCCWWVFLICFLLKRAKIRKIQLLLLRLTWILLQRNMTLLHIQFLLYFLVFSFDLIHFLWRWL